jgi:hypothetical protein
MSITSLIVNVVFTILSEVWHWLTTKCYLELNQAKKTAQHGKAAEAEADEFFSKAKRRLNTAKQLKQRRMDSSARPKDGSTRQSS